MFQSLTPGKKNLINSVKFYFIVCILIIIEIFTYRTPSAFDLWYEDNKSELLDEFPDLSDEDLTQIAAERFRELSKEQRQVQ